jgi:hypothetical protein
VEIFQKINLSLSRKSAKNVDTSIPVKEVIKNFGQVARLGFKPSTIGAVGKQLVDEKLDKWKTTRRRTTQSILAFDVFLNFK